MFTPILPPDGPTNGGKKKASKPPTSAVQKSGTFGGRRFQETDKITEEDRIETIGRQRDKKPEASVDNLEKMLENDAAALLNMRKDITMAQQAEVEKARKSLASLQKECDTARIQNELKDRELADLQDQIKALKVEELRVLSTRETARKDIAVLNEQLLEVQDNMLAERRTHNVLSYMKLRLEEEIMQCRMKGHDVTQQLDLARAEASGIESTLRLCKQELMEEEKLVDTLQKSIRSRGEQRRVKMGELQSIVMEGENSVARVQASMQSMFQLMHTNKELEGFGEQQSGELDGADAVLPSGQQVNTGAQNTTTRPLHSTYTTATTNALGEEGLAGVGGTEFRLTKTQIEEIEDRFMTRHYRIERLAQMQSDLKESIMNQRSHKQSLEGLLERSNQKLLLLASNRQVYQEVDLKDAALATARKQGEECRDKEQRLRSDIEALRRSIPRLLTKITHTTQPLCSLEQLPDAVHKLDDEVARLIKHIGDRMLKDATPEDLASMASVQDYSRRGSGGASDSTSESSRLHKLPGYSRLHKQLFINLMSAVPDESPRNIRVSAKAGTEMDAGDIGTVTAETDSEDLQHPSISERTKTKKVVTNDEYVDRTTIKDISRLIVSRDSAQGPRSNSKKKKASPRRRVNHLDAAPKGGASDE